MLRYRSKLHISLEISRAFLSCNWKYWSNFLRYQKSFLFRFHRHGVPRNVKKNVLGVRPRRKVWETPFYKDIKFASKRSNGPQNMGWWEDTKSILCVHFMQTMQQYSWLQSHLRPVEYHVSFTTCSCIPLLFRWLSTLRNFINRV
jgi:hypothetical protein